MLANTRIILVNPSHPGNIGAVARAMKNMGLQELYLVDPVAFPHKDAFVRASGAADILDNACVVSTLSDALVDCKIVYAASARLRYLSREVLNPRVCAERITAQSEKAAVVFGREDAGLTNEEVAHCHCLVHIPTAAEFSSLNLGAAVQVIAYELRMASLSDLQPFVHGEENVLASGDQVYGLMTHIESTLTALEFLDPKQPKMLMQRLQRLFNRTHLEEKEIHILRGIFSSMDYYMREHS